VSVPIFDSWINLSPVSWISASTGCGVNDPGCPTGVYTYETCWCQCAGGGSVSLDVAADNEAIVFFNNSLAPGGAIPTPTPPGTEFKGTAHVAFPYEAGGAINCIQIEVTNFDDGSATALLVSGMVTGINAPNGGECAADVIPTPPSTATRTPSRTPTRTKTSVIDPST
jgi:hypothetical protein